MIVTNRRGQVLYDSDGGPHVPSRNDPEAPTHWWARDLNHASSPQAVLAAITGWVDAHPRHRTIVLPA